ncbi:MAG: hypothetical protein SXQ77_08865 [Halobacteria archaeon]|nr:hypothetical protein [Halobacteria archaeon]
MPDAENPVDEVEDKDGEQRTDRKYLKRLESRDWYKAEKEYNDEVIKHNSIPAMFEESADSDEIGADVQRGRIQQKSNRHGNTRSTRRRVRDPDVQRDAGYSPQPGGRFP